MAEKKPIFEVDKRGLAEVMARKHPAFVLTELTQNAWDADDVTEVEVVLRKHDDGRYEVQVADDSPDGFADLRHAYTLFASNNTKRKDATKRGRFNIGEKLTIAVCDHARIETTKATIEFDADGRTEYPPKRKAGTLFVGVLKMTDQQAEEAEAIFRTLIPPPGLRTTFNAVELAGRKALRTFEASLRTELADAEGYLRPTRRKTEVGVYEPLPGEAATLYELGIPVVEIGGRWSVDVGQKVPLNTDRDNVQPSYLRDVRAMVLNNCADLLGEEDADEKWLDDALTHKDVSAEAVKAVIAGRYGDKVVIDDPTDREGTKIAVSQGYAVIPAGAFSKQAWKAIKETEAAKPAGQVTPSPNPHEGESELSLMDPEHYPEGVRMVVDYAQALGRELLDAEVTVRVANEVTWPYVATYGPRRGGTEGQLTFNYGRLGHKWFADGACERVDRLILHEFGHHYSDDHLSESFHDAICKVGAALVQLALEKPDLIRSFERQSVAL